MLQQDRHQIKQQSEQLVAREVAWAEASQQSLTLIYLDVDHFRQVNDTYGHDAGDEVLNDLSRIVQQQIEDTDTMARCGGEEYIVLSRERDLPGAEALAEAIRGAVERHPFSTVGRVTVSLGVTDHCVGDTPAGLIARAETAARRAKSDGRNRVYVAR